MKIIDKKVVIIYIGVEVIYFLFSSLMQKIWSLWSPFPDSKLPHILIGVFHNSTRKKISLYLQTNLYLYVSASLSSLKAK